MATYLSSTGATIGSQGPLAPMSMMKALRTCIPGFMTRWDFVIPENPALPAANSNIKHYVEVKFGDDELTENQRKARRWMTPDEKAKIVVIKPNEDCVCSKSGGLTVGRAC